MPHHHLIEAAMVHHQSHQIGIDILIVSMTEEAQVAEAAIVMGIHPETVIMTKGTPLTAIAQVITITAVLVMVTQHPVTVLLPQTEMDIALQGVAALTMVEGVLAMAEGVLAMAEGVQAMAEGVQVMAEEVQAMAGEVQAMVVVALVTVVEVTRLVAKMEALAIPQIILHQETKALITN